MRHVLEARNICQYFGGVRAVDDVSLQVDEGEILGIIGPNGSGKTTLFNVLSGIYRPTAGSFFFYGDEITGLPAHQIAQRGISRTFQTLRTFHAMTVLENTVVGQHRAQTVGVLDALFRLKNHRVEEREVSEKAGSVLELVGIGDLTHRLANELSYGQQKRLELARAVVSEPKLLLLDEPTAGIPREDSEELMNLVLKIREEKGITVIIIEHNMRVMAAIADRIIAMDRGQQIAEGACQDVLEEPCVIEAYLGEELREC